MLWLLDMVYYISMVVSVLIVLSGIHILYLSDQAPHGGYFRHHGWCYTAIVFSTLLSCYYLTLMVDWLSHSYSLSLDTSFNARWAIFHFAERLVVLIFHEHIRRKIKRVVSGVGYDFPGTHLGWR